MDMKRASVRTIAGETEVDHAIATLVLAFSTDPVARWMYDDPHQYLQHTPRLFKALQPYSRPLQCQSARDRGRGRSHDRCRAY